MLHILEVHFSPIEAIIPDRVNEGLSKACIKYGPVALKKSDRLRGTSTADVDEHAGNQRDRRYRLRHGFHDPELHAPEAGV